MSRYIRTANLGFGNYGGLARTWGFGDDERRGPRARGGALSRIASKIKEDAIEIDEKTREKIAARMRKEAAKRALIEKRKREKQGEREEKEDKEERARLKRQAKRELREEIEEKRKAAEVESLRDEIAAKKVRQRAEEAMRAKMALSLGVPITTLPMVRGPVPMAYGPRPMMPGAMMPRPGAMPQPRRPARAPTITPQQARLGTLAAALASAMLLF